jgi:anaerobic selenocysteine-containing dehydrogenase
LLFELKGRKSAECVKNVVSARDIASLHSSEMISQCSEVNFVTNLSKDTEVMKTVCMLCFQIFGINAHLKEGKLTKVEPMREHPFSRGGVVSQGLALARLHLFFLTVDVPYEDA